MSQATRAIPRRVMGMILLALTVEMIAAGLVTLLPHMASR